MAGRTQVNINGYTVDDSPLLADDLLNVSTDSTLVLLGADVLLDDAISGAGRVSDRAVTTIDDGLTLGGSALFVDMDLIAQNSGDLVLGQTAADAVVARNIEDGFWNLSNNAGITGVGSSEFVNLGSLGQNGGTSTIDANFFDREGTLDIGGVLNFNSPGDVNRFIDDQIEGLGTFEVNGGVLIGSNITTATTDLTGTRTVGDVTINSANVNIDGLNPGAGSVLSLTDDAANIVLGGEIKGPGAITIDGGSVQTTGQGTQLAGATTLTNSGDTSFTGDSGGLVLTTDPWSGDEVTIENAMGATWTDKGQSSTIEQTAGPGTSVFNNDGTFVEDTSGGVTFSMAVQNNGFIEAGEDVTATANSVPDFVFKGAVGGSGEIEVGPNNVTFDAPVASTQFLNFNVGGTDLTPTLILDDASDFASTISGFDKGAGADDRITLNSSSSPWEFQGYNSNSGSLDFANASGATAAINLGGVYNADDFHAIASGTSTTITYG